MYIYIYYMNQYTSTILPKSRHLQPEKTWQKCKVSGSCPKYSTSRQKRPTEPPHHQLLSTLNLASAADPACRLWRKTYHWANQSEAIGLKPFLMTAYDRYNDIII